MSVLLDPDLARQFRPWLAYARGYPPPERFTEHFDAEIYRTRIAARGDQPRQRPLALSVSAPVSGRRRSAARREGTSVTDATAGDPGLIEGEVALYDATLSGSRAVVWLELSAASGWPCGEGDIVSVLRTLEQVFEFRPSTRYSAALPSRFASEVMVRALVRSGFVELEIDADADGARIEVPAIGSSWGEAIARMEQCGVETLSVKTQLGSEGADRILTAIQSMGRAAPVRITLADREPGMKPAPVSSAVVRDDDRALETLAHIIDALVEFGWVYVGAGCFVPAHDPFAEAHRHRRLYMSTLGYTLCGAVDVIGFGTGTRSSVGSCHVQNRLVLSPYAESLMARRFPVARGIELTRYDLVRRSIIHELTCYGCFSVESMVIGYLLKFPTYFERELAELREFERIGILSQRRDWIQVEPHGLLLVGHVSAIFDRYRNPQGDPVVHPPTDQ